MNLNNPRIWTEAELDAERLQAIERFRCKRLEEPADAYGEHFEAFQGQMEELLEATLDLRGSGEQQLAHVLSDPKYLYAFRYLPGPPISEDDLKVLAETTSLSPKQLRGDPLLRGNLENIIRSCIDRRRFPWMSEGREPTDAERDAAVLASAALMATQKIQTSRRNEEMREQEGLVKQSLRDMDFKEVKRRVIAGIHDAPGVGEYCGESKVADQKADVIAGLWDRRTLLIECKASNSEVNSIKRLNRDSAAKVSAWKKGLGETNIVPVAVIGGVFNLSRLLEAQEVGMFIFWSHNLAPFIDWCKSLRPL